MARPLKFPSSVEIKRVLAAATRAGIDIGSVEIHPAKITIYPRHEDAPALTDYERWKLTQPVARNRVDQEAENSVALPKKPRG